VLETDAKVRVTRHEDHLEFAPRADGKLVNLLFFPGGMVQIEAYAPMARAIAETGYRVVLVRLPFLGRHAPSDEHQREALQRAIRQFENAGPDIRWVVAAHSFGGVLASRLAAERHDAIRALVLIGTTHPRDVDLSSTDLPVLKILGTRDGVASPAGARVNAARLPADTRWVEIAGANHAQFGYYGPQLGDDKATITREEQQRRLVELIMSELNHVAHQTQTVRQQTRM
jgi:pimeloyl-ACP methyl ester carboxylesterase